MALDILVLQINDLPARAEAALAERFQVVRLPLDHAERNAVLTEVGPRIRAIAGTGKGRVDGELLDHLPNLEIISSYSAGLDQIDTEAAARRNIPIASTSAILADDVADLALWLLTSVARNLLNADKFVRGGNWEHGMFPLAQSIAGMKVGILGLGHIGKSLARRLAVMRAEVAYCGRNRQDIDYAYFETLTGLASWADTLVVCCPATNETENLVDAAVLTALGTDGLIINISRGSIIDEPALITALHTGAIAGAGLDVFTNEPHVPQEFVQSERVVLLPHLGSATTATRDRMGEAMIAALTSHFGKPTSDCAAPE